MNQTIEQKITHLEHLLEVSLKNQQTIKAHLWSDEDGKFYQPKGHETKKDELAFQEHEAEAYVNNIILPKIKGEEIGIKGFWQGAVLNYLKQQTLNFIGHTLKKLALEKAVEFSKWLMTEAEEQIIKTYHNSTEEEKETFKNKLQEAFPNSSLLKKLK